MEEWASGCNDGLNEGPLQHGTWIFNERSMESRTRLRTGLLVLIYATGANFVLNIGIVLSRFLLNDVG